MIGVVKFRSVRLSLNHKVRYTVPPVQRAGLQARYCRDMFDSLETTFKVTRTRQQIVGTYHTLLLLLLWRRNGRTIFWLKLQALAIRIVYWL